MISKQAVLDVLAHVKKYGQIDEALNTQLIDNINAIPSISDGCEKMKKELNKMLDDVTNPDKDFGEAYDQLRNFKHKYFPSK